MKSELKGTMCMRNEVIKTIEKDFSEKIKIEEIQDLIEQSLDKLGYKEVYTSSEADFNPKPSIVFKNLCILLSSIKSSLDWLLLSR